jgi:hypothetical protein
MGAYHVKFVDVEGGGNNNLGFEIDKLVRSGGQILFFPEGTRSRDRTSKQIKTGVMRMIHNANIPYTVVPITMTYQRRPEESSLDIQKSKSSKPRSFVNLMGLSWWVWSLVIGSNEKCGRCNAEFGKHFMVEPSKKSVESVVAAIKTLWDNGKVVWDEQMVDIADIEYIQKHGIKQLTHPKQKIPTYIMCGTERNNWINESYKES